MSDIVDVSHHNGAIDWAAVKHAGHDSVLMKTTEGTTFVDPAFHPNWAAARQAGFKVGAYHFLSPQSSGDDQARAFVAAIQPHGRGFADLELGVAVDVEWYPRGGHDLWLDLQPEARVALLATFIQGLARAAPQAPRPMIYTGAEFWREMMHDAAESSGLRFADYPLWCPSYSKTALVAAPWAGRYRLWQYTAKGSVPGIQGEVDLSRLGA